jgi:acetylornithine/succinyldiaminopimelate/putrescine aminotransferase
MSTQHNNHIASHSEKHQEAIETSRRYLNTIKSKTISRAAAEALIAETLRNFANHYNPGFLDYRKSVTEGGDFAAVEWSGRGATFTDALGRTFLDCLGGYGLLSLGWSHEKVIEAVKAQLDRAPMPTQDLLDPPRGMLANLLAQITPGDLQYAFMVSSGTEAVEGAIKFAKAATGKSGFIAAVRGFHGKTAGSLSLMGKAVFRKPALPLLPNVYHVPYGDAGAVEQQLRIAREVGNDIAAVIMEPVQGEAGAIATINVILEEDLPRQAAEKGAYFMERLQSLVDRYPTIYERITGKGLLLCQHFHDSDVGYKVSAGLFHRGVLLGGTLTNAKTIRIEPPLVIEYDEIDEVLNRLEDTLQAVSGAPVTGEVQQTPVAAVAKRPTVKRATRQAAARPRVSAHRKETTKESALA